MPFEQRSTNHQSRRSGGLVAPWPGSRARAAWSRPTMPTPSCGHATRPPRASSATGASISHDAIYGIDDSFHVFHDQQRRRRDPFRIHERLIDVGIGVDLNLRPESGERSQYTNQFVEERKIDFKLRVANQSHRLVSDFVSVVADTKRAVRLDLSQRPHLHEPTARCLERVLTSTQYLTFVVLVNNLSFVMGPAMYEEASYLLYDLDAKLLPAHEKQTRASKIPKDRVGVKLSHDPLNVLIALADVVA